MGGISNRMDELNTILASTQKHINRFKVWHYVIASPLLIHFLFFFLLLQTSCGSFTNMLKAKIGGRRNSTASLDTQSENGEISNSSSPQRQSQNSAEFTQRQTDLNRGIDGNLEKLDSLLDKAETAHYSMLDQRKRMEKMLK